jgi:ketosteroid isomerase-like protein
VEAKMMTDITARAFHIVLVVGIALFGANQARAANGTDITNEMQKFCNNYDTRWNTKGPATVANTMYAEDVVFIPPNGAVIKGKETIAKIWGDIYEEPTVHKCTVLESHAEGDGAWSYGESTITGNPAGHVRWAGFYIQQDGQWKVKMLSVNAIQEK